MAITISDIAREAGVSTATVSRMMNQSGYVSDKAREKIETAIKKLNYMPNAAAISLSKRVSKVIGVMVPEISNPFFGEVIEGISQIADSKGYAVMLFDTAEAQDREIKALTTLKQQNLCGLILTPVFDDMNHNPDFYGALIQLKIPVVLVDREVEGLDVSGVFCDNVEGAFDLTASLISEGHTRIAVMAGDQNLRLGRDRLEGYMKAMRYFNQPLDPLLIYYGDFNRTNAREKTIEMVKGDRLPTAILSCNNIMTEGIIHALSERGMLEQVTIASYDKLPWTNYIGLRVKHLERSALDMGIKATQLILSQCSDSDRQCINKRLIVEQKVI
ncbi:MAG: LacI family transcriptional regulator [Firmicutes bacterium]|nr:LacI family transcriptional regulator [Bacillota bacterium]